MEPTRDPPFWETLHTGTGRIALVDARTGEELSYGALADMAADVAGLIRLPAKGVVFVYPEIDPGGIACYLGALLAGHAVHLSSARLEHPSSAPLIEAYRPEWILWRSGSVPSSVAAAYEAAPPVAGYQALRRLRPDSPPPSPDLALLLSTSASTGTPKFVRISRRAITAATDQVVSALGIQPCERAITSLPYSYVYGLSVVNSHLRAGASIVLEGRTAGQRAFWETVRQTGTTTLPGVSITYDFMRQLRVDELPLHSLSKLTHAGEAVRRPTVTWLAEHLGGRPVQIFLMYGQTEASGRIAVLPPRCFPQQAHAVGYPVKWGNVSLSSENEVLFRGPNVMLGYASGRQDLGLGDECHGLLGTGDLGYIDPDGLLCITGRLSRRCKILGRRVSLEDVESYFQDVCPVAALDGGGKIILFVEDSEQLIRARARQFTLETRLPRRSVQVRRLGSLPRTESGKLSYRMLAAMLP